jgi:hypothetical protein
MAPVCLLCHQNKADEFDHAMTQGSNKLRVVTQQLTESGCENKWQPQHLVILKCGVRSQTNQSLSQWQSLLPSNWWVAGVVGREAICLKQLTDSACPLEQS